MRGAKLSLTVGVGIVLSLARVSWAQTAPLPTAVPPVTAQVPAVAKNAYRGPEYVRSEAMISARDGVMLHTVV